MRSDCERSIDKTTTNVQINEEREVDEREEKGDRYISVRCIWLISTNTHTHTQTHRNKKKIQHMRSEQLKIMCAFGLCYLKYLTHIHSYRQRTYTVIHIDLTLSFSVSRIYVERAHFYMDQKYNLHTIRSLFSTFTLQTNLNCAYRNYRTYKHTQTHSHTRTQKLWQKFKMLGGSRESWVTFLFASVV